MVDIRSLDLIVQGTLVAVEEGRNEIFNAGETARNELERLQSIPEAAANRGLLEEKGCGLMQVVEQADTLLDRLGMALQCLQGAAPDADLAEDLPGWKKAGRLAIRMLDNERHRIAREIHDGPAQAMANLLLKTIFCEQQLTGEPSAVRDELLSLKEIIRSSLLDIRTILFDLQPKGLDQGLVSGLHRLIAEYRERYGLQVAFNCSGQDRRLDSQVSSALFRIVQEALNNAYKHSCSDQARVDMELNEHWVTILIDDEGKGFDLQEAESHNGHYGLMNMRERAHLLDGELDVITTPGQGTRVVVTIPIE